jgi:hypothetical protein
MAYEEAGHGTAALSASVPKKRGPAVTLLFVLLVLFPAIVSLGILFRQSLNAPYQDDYAVVLDFSTKYVKLPTPQSKLVFIATSQVNEYKLAFSHAVVAAELAMVHRVNFAFLTVLGNLFLPAIAFLLWLTYREEEQDLPTRLLAFVPISFLFFSLTYWENLNWATTDLQNIPVIFFALLAIYLLLGKERTNGPRLLLACVAAALAAFTSANGFLLGPIGLFVLWTRRSYGKAAIWCASFVLPLAAYLYHYAPVAHELLPTRWLTRPLFFLAFLGCGAIPLRWPAALAGVVILFIFWKAVRARFDRIQPAGFYFTVWILGTAALVAWVRGATAFLVGSRYSIYSLLLLIFCYSFLARAVAERMPGFDRRRFYVTASVLSFLLFVVANVHAYGKLGARRRMVLTGIELYRADPIANSPMIDQNLLKGFPQERAWEQDALTRAIEARVYALPLPQKPTN